MIALTFANVIMLWCAALLAWRVYQLSLSMGRQMELLRAAQEAQSPRPVLKATDIDGRMQEGMEQAPELFQHARQQQAQYVEALAAVQAACPHHGVQPGGYCDACQGRAPIPTSPHNAFT